MLRLAPIIAVLLAAAACGGDGALKPGAAQNSVSTCPVTLPGSVPPPAEDYGVGHGNGKLWVGLWPHGVIIATPDFVREDGWVAMKTPWWRGVRGELRIEGHRLDAPAPPLAAHVPDGYGPTGFQPSGITYPTEGCWRVTGTVADASLSFVTVVVKAG